MIGFERASFSYRSVGALGKPVVRDVSQIGRAHV